MDQEEAKLMGKKETETAPNRFKLSKERSVGKNITEIHHKEGGNFDLEKPYDDRACIRYRNAFITKIDPETGHTEPNSQCLILNENRFNKEVTDHSRINDPYWLRVEIIHTIVKSRIGIGAPIYIDFFAPINEAKPSEEIDYTYKGKLTEYDLISKGQEEAYCQKQCLKYCYYISKVKGIEVLKMRVEFLKDENGFIWLFYARDISCRKNANNKDLNSKDAKAKSQQIQANKVKMRNQMVEEL